MYKLPVCDVKTTDYNCIHNTVSPEEFIRILEQVVAPRLDNGEFAGLDIEGSNLNPHAMSFDLTGTGISIANDTSTGYSWYCDHKYPHSIISGELLTRYKAFLSKYAERLVVFNCSMEIKSLWATTGEVYYFTDSRALVSAAGRFGSLKVNAQELVNAPEWEGLNSAAVDAFDDISSIFRKHYSKQCYDARQARISNEVLNIEFRWEECIPELSVIKSEIDYPSVVDAVSKNDTGDLSRVQAKFIKAAQLGITEDEVYQSMMYDISSGWGGVPTRFLSPYCGDDCFYTLQLFNLLNQDPVIRKAYPLLQDEIMVGGIMESFGINWNDDVAADLEYSYLRDMSESLKYLLPRLKLDIDKNDPLGWRRELVDKIVDSNLPFTYEVRTEKGGYKYTPDSQATIATVRQMENYRDAIFPENYLDDPQLQPVKFEAPVFWIKTLQAEISDLVDEMVDSKNSLISDYDIDYDTVDLSTIEVTEDINELLKIVRSCERKIATRNNKLEEIRNSPQLGLIGSVITPEVYDTLTPPIVISYTSRAGEPHHIVSRTEEVNTPADLVDLIKDEFFNPGSTTQDTKDAFWNAYLTPRMMTANISHGILTYLSTSNILQHFEAKKVVDPVTQEVSYEIPTVKIVKKDGSIEVKEYALFDRSDVQSSLARMQEYERKVSAESDIPYKLIGKGAILNGMTPEELKVHTERSEAYALQGQMRSAIGVIMSSLRSWTGQGCGLDTDTLEYHHKVHKDILGFNIDDESTWSPEYWMLHKFRIYKKCNKNLTTYINGNKLGRGSVAIINSSPADRSDPIRNAEAHPEKLISRISVPLEESLSPSRPLMHYYDQTDIITDCKRDHRLILETDFFTLGTETRRWKSRNHTVPANSELRRCYHPHYPGWLREHSDYSGAELCVVAAITNCKAMLHAFMTGGDVHMITSMGVYGLPAEQITDMMRRYCKIITFRLLYGSTVEGLADELNISYVRAKEMVDGFMATYPELEDYIKWSRAHARKYGWVPSITGAPLNINKYDPDIDQKSINYRIQASSTNLAGSGIGRMWKTYYKLKFPWMPESFTHDSIDSSIHPMFYPVHTFLSKRMSEDDNVAAWNCPMRMDFEVGSNGYDICGVKNKSDNIYSGLTPDRPIVINLHGTSISVKGVLDSMEPFFDINVIELSRKDSRYENDLWIPKRSYSTTFGQPVTKLSVDAYLTYKKDTPQFGQLMNILGSDYVSESHAIIENSFRKWTTVGTYDKDYMSTAVRYDTRNY